MSACDVGNYIMCELRTQSNTAGNFTKMIDIKPGELTVKVSSDPDCLIM